MTTTEQIALVQDYIYARKGVRVTIQQPRDYVNQVKLEIACAVARDWFENEKTRQDGRN
jgi:hypothetical protein